MQIVYNSMVSFHYILKDAKNQELLESTYDLQPKRYIHGVSDLLNGLALELAGKSKGDKFDLNLPPEQAYGHYNEQAAGRVPLKYVTRPDGRPVIGKLKSGDAVEIRTEQGVFDGRVIKQGLKTVDIDTNHPFAGKSLVFSVEVLDVRAATAAELAAEQESCQSGCGCC